MILAKKPPFIRLNHKGSYDFGLYTEGKRRDALFGCSPTRSDAEDALISTLRHKANRSLWLSSVSASLGGICLAHAMLRMNNDVATWVMQLGITAILSAGCVLASNWRSARRVRRMQSRVR